MSAPQQPKKQPPLSPEQAKEYFSKADANGYSVMDHLARIISQVLENNPENVASNVGKFETFSHTLKKDLFQPLPKRDTAAFRESLRQDSATVERAAAVKGLFRQAPARVITTIKKPKPNVTVTTTEVKPRPAPRFSSIAYEARYWELGGIGFPQNEAFLIDLAISKLASEKKLKDIRFFGKIFGRYSDYIVVESARWYPEPDHKNYQEKNVMPNPPRKGVVVDVQEEPMGKGVNRYSYWVTAFPSGEWTHLPDVTPQQINVARQIRKFFTGDLDHELNTHPAFPGKEINYLRAQIARITAATQISPAGALVKHEEEDEEEPEDEEEGAKKPKEEKTKPLTDRSDEFPGETEEGIKTFANQEMWVHHTQYLYKTGRATKVPEKEIPEGEEEAQPEEEEEEPAEKPEDDVEILEPIAKDKLFAKVKLPVEKIEGEEGDEAEEEKGDEEPKEGEEEEKEEENEEEDEEEEDPEHPKNRRVPAWVCHLRNAFYRAHGTVLVRSHRWPGAYAYAAEGGKAWGTIYVGYGLKAAAKKFAPTPAPEIMKEPEDMPEMADPSAKAEKLLLRGEELPDKDSEAGDAPEEEQEEPEED
eukprot:TRINITY_DN1556_c0_g1_i1.p1 TRINITY_DN1556_c0_g1~~TRINITY_DN1556_c0_g1_i1.p1  ORF type:complete len:589 (+),score=140.75 TRINITY_DN1556_c0_g1_i1:93-1859(+)